MKAAGTISIWLGIILFVLAIAAFAVPTALAFATGQGEILMWSTIAGIVAIPALILAAFLILAGAALVMSAKPKQASTAPTPPASAPPAAMDISALRRQRSGQAPLVSDPPATPVRPAPTSAMQPDQLRAALTQRRSEASHGRIAIWALRGIALLVFAWIFLPEAIGIWQFWRITPDNWPVWPTLLNVVLLLIKASFVPLALWIASILVARRLPAYI